MFYFSQTRSVHCNATVANSFVTTAKQCACMLHREQNYDSHYSPKATGLFYPGTKGLLETLKRT